MQVAKNVIMILLTVVSTVYFMDANAMCCTINFNCKRTRVMVVRPTEPADQNMEQENKQIAAVQPPAIIPLPNMVEITVNVTPVEPA